MNTPSSPPPPIRICTIGWGVVQLHRVRFRPDTAFPEHAHARWGVAIPLQGRVTSKSRRGRRGVVPGEALGIDPGIPHTNGTGSRGSVHLLVELEGNGDGVGPDGREPTPGPRPIEPGTVALARRLFAALEGPGPGPIEVERCILLLDAIVGGYAPPSTSPDWLDRVRERVLDDPLDPPGLRELGELAGVHPSTVLRSFRARYGATPAELNRTWRLEEAARRLLEGARPLAAIAVELGFADQSHFTRVFRRRFGTTPGRYRAAAGR